jgi:cobalt-zinc-cadmium efflux system outer membrane protein
MWSAWRAIVVALAMAPGAAGQLPPAATPAAGSLHPSAPAAVDHLLGPAGHLRAQAAAAPHPERPVFVTRFTPSTEPPPAQPPEEPDSSELIPPGMLSPPATGPLTLADLESVALNNNPALTAASARLRAARGNWQQVGLPPNPVLSYAATEVGNEGQAGQQGMFVGQELVLGHKLRLNRNVASYELRLAEQELAARRLRVLNDVRIGYFQVLAAQRKLELARHVVGLAQQGVQTTEKLLQLLEVSQSDLLSARIEVNAARITLQQAAAEHAAAWRRLRAVLGTPDAPPAPLAGDLASNLPDFDWDTVLRQLLASSPELAAAQAQIGRARWALSRARAEPVPNVQLSLGVQFDDATDDVITGMQLGVPVPLLNRNQGAIAQANAELAATRAEALRIQLQLQQRLAAVFERFESSRAQVRLYQREILPDSQRSLELVSAGYRQGELSFLSYLNAQRTFAQTHREYLDALRQLRTAAVEIEGLLLRDGLSP